MIKIGPLYYIKYKHLTFNSEFKSIVFRIDNTFNKDYILFKIWLGRSQKNIFITYDYSDSIWLNIREIKLLPYSYVPWLYSSIFNAHNEKIDDIVNYYQEVKKQLLESGIVLEQIKKVFLDNQKNIS